MGNLMKERLDSITEKSNNFTCIQSTPQMPAFNQVFGDVMTKFFTQDQSSHFSKTNEDASMDLGELP